MFALCSRKQGCSPVTLCVKIVDGQSYCLFIAIRFLEEKRYLVVSLRSLLIPIPKVL